MSLTKNLGGKELEQLLAEILQIPVTKVTGDLAMKDLEVWDSLKHMELVASLERSLNIQFTFDEIVAMQSVGAIKQILKEKA